jgi:hypothetical protein
MNLQQWIGRRERLKQAPGIAESARTAAPYLETMPSSHAWIGRFAAHLMQLRPSMKLGSAVQYAVMSIHHAADLDPQRAAELLALASATPEPVGDRYSARRIERHTARYQALFAARTSRTAHV